MEQIGLFLNVSRETSDEDLITLAKQADGLGYHSFWTGESWGRDAFTILTMVACHTENLRLGTGIVTTYSRTPALIAQTVASLDILSKGRAILGLGSSGKVVVEGWHGVPFDSPVSRTKEYIEIIRKAFSGNRVEHQGEFYKMERFRMISLPVQKKVPIYMASLGPKNLVLTGENADGCLPIWVNRERFPEIREQISIGAAKSGRKASDVTIAPYIFCYTSDGPNDMAHGEQLLRAHLAYYVGGMGTFYFNSVSRAGFNAEAKAIKNAWESGNREQAARSVSDRMLDSIVVLGEPQKCRDQISAFRKVGVDLPIINFPHGTNLTTMGRTISALAPKEDSLIQASV